MNVLKILIVAALSASIHLSAANDTASKAAKGFLSGVKDSAKASATEAAGELSSLKQMKTAMEKVNSIPTSASDFFNGKLTRENAEKILKNLREAPVKDTSEDFQAAYGEVVKSYENVCTLAQKVPTSSKAAASSLLKSLAEESTGGNVAQAKDDVAEAFAELGKSRTNLVTIAKKYLK